MARPPLFTRWGDLLFEDTMAQRGCLLAWFAIIQGILPNIPAPGCWPYVAAVISLQLGLLAFLDYRDWVRNEVQQAASMLDPNLSVSSMLLLSSPELQNEYHRWMDKTPAVAWFPYFVALVCFFFAVKILTKGEDECSGLSLIVPLPAMVLALVRVAMEIGGAPKQLQSIASLSVLAYSMTAVTGLVALNNPCELNTGPNWMSPAGIALFVALSTAVQFATTPCTMQDLPALCAITGTWPSVSAFIRSQKLHGGLGLISYPNHYVELGIIVAAAKTAALLVAVSVRYRLALESMTAFLRSVRRPHRH